MNMYDEYLKFKEKQVKLRENRLKSLEDFVFMEKITESQKKIINQVMKDKKTIIIVGDTQSGKSDLCYAINREKLDKSFRINPDHLNIEEWFSNDDEIKKGEDISKLLFRCRLSRSYNIMTLNLTDKKENTIKATFEKLEEYISEISHKVDKNEIFNEIFENLSLIILMESDKSGKVKEIFEL